MDALGDLMMEMGIHPTIKVANPDLVSEAGVTKVERLNIAREGGLIWRNNVGAMNDGQGRVVRYGLANESKTMNRRVKSSDLIGLKPVLITEGMVGYIIGQFVARECKRPKWAYSGTPREKAQKCFIELVLAKGGDACFTTGS